MPTPTYDLIASNVLSSSASSVTFSSIPATYRDLILVDSLTPTGSGIASLITFNSDSGANYSFVYMLGDGSSTGSAQNTGQTFLASCYSSATVRGVGIMNIMDYSATDKHKTVITKRKSPDTFVIAYAQRWANTAAINSITITANTGSFASGSTFYLFGIVS